MENTPVTETLAQVTFSAAETARMEERAQTIYATAQASAAAAERMGMSLRPIQRATLEEIRTHLFYCAALGQLHQCGVNPDAYFGQTPEAIAEAVCAKAAQHRRGAGARAVARKYGDQAAYRITGHRIRR